MKMFEIYKGMNARKRYAVKYYVTNGMSVNDAVTYVYLHGVGHLLSQDFYNANKNK